MLLAADPDERIRNLASHTLLNWNVEELRQVLANPITFPEILDFAMNYLLYGHEDLLEAIIQNPALHRGSAEVPADDSGTAAEPESKSSFEEGEIPDGEKEAKRETLLQRLGRMSAAGKIRTALLGNQEERLILVRDSNKAVARAVIQSPKLSEMEVESFAAMKTVTEEILRMISMNRAFTRHYAVILALVNNPRAPIDVTVPLVNRLNDRDIKTLSINKNVPDAVRQTAIRRIQQKQQK